MNIKQFKITSFKSSKSPTGVPYQLTAKQFYLTMKTEFVRTAETVEEYKKYDRATRGKIKDKGGYIFGETKNNQRTKGAIINRSMITLDLDYCDCEICEVLEEKAKTELQFPFMYYTTHSHTPERPRLRLIVPLAESISPEIYPLVSMEIASRIGEENFDATTYEPNRIMYFPTCPLDGEYKCELLNEDLPFANADELVVGCLDKKDIRTWQRPHYIEGLKIKEIQDGYKDSTKTKFRVVNCFNKAYSIDKAINEFLSNVYKFEGGDRYTYIKGESKGGLVILNNQYAYSHHGTDPANGRLLDAFRIVQIHKFGVDEISNPEVPTDKVSSFKAMCDWITATVPQILNSDPKRLETVAKAKAKQENLLAVINNKDDRDIFEVVQNKVYDLTIVPEWNSLLHFTKNGDVAKTIDNIITIVQHDPRLQELFFYDVIKQDICFLRAPYWDENIKVGTGLRDLDMSFIRNIISGAPFFIGGETAIYDAIKTDAYSRRKNFIKEFLEDLPEWDGVPRFEDLFVNLFGVVSSGFVREASKKWLTALVARIYQPGVKFDYVITLIGAVGTGKSTFGKSLVAPQWDGDMEHIEDEEYYFTDTEIDLKNQRDTIDALRGMCVVELAEFDKFFRKYDKASLKAFLTKTQDRFIERYGKRTQNVPRSFVMLATSNTHTPIKDPEDERRFLPFYCTLKKHDAKIFDLTVWNKEIRDQVLAEAKHYYKEGYKFSAPFTMSQQKEWESLLTRASIASEESDFVFDYVTKKFPANYCKTTDLEEMKSLAGKNYGNYRTEFCLEEIYTITMGKEKNEAIPFIVRQQMIDALRVLGFEQALGGRQQFGAFGYKRVWYLRNDSPLMVLQKSEEEQRAQYKIWKAMASKNEIGRLERDILGLLEVDLQEGALSEVVKVDKGELDF